MKFIQWLTQYNKAFVPLVTIGIYFLNRQYGIDIPLTDMQITLIFTALASALTYLVPNTKL